jgi:hypothetical protein
MSDNTPPLSLLRVRVTVFPCPVREVGSDGRAALLHEHLQSSTLLAPRYHTLQVLPLYDAITSEHPEGVH